MVIAADRAATIATTIQRNCRNVGQVVRFWWVARAARIAPVKANGSAKTECSNLIISSTVRMRPAIPRLRLRLFGALLTRPAIHIFLGHMNLREHAANILGDKVVDRLWM